MSKEKKFWNKIAANYDKRVFKKFSGTYNKTVDLSSKYYKPEFTALDFACGTGITTIQLAKFASKIIAFDISDKMIDIAKQKSESLQIKNIEFLVTDIFDSKFDNQKFDIITAFNILSMFDDLPKILNRIYSLLSPEGIFLSTTDCLGEKKSILVYFYKFLSKIGIIPKMKFYSIKEIENIFTKNHFQILESHNLFINPPNYFIASKKNP